LPAKGRTVLVPARHGARHAMRQLWRALTLLLRSLVLQARPRTPAPPRFLGRMTTCRASAPIPNAVLIALAWVLAPGVPPSHAPVLGGQLGATQGSALAACVPQTPGCEQTWKLGDGTAACSGLWPVKGNARGVVRQCGGLLAAPKCAAVLYSA